MLNYISTINLADAMFKDAVNQILAYGYLDENPRPKYVDGTPAHSYSINQVMRKYDLSDDNYPIMTLRPQAWKSAIKEILWIFQDQSNSLELLRSKYGIHYWDEWDIGDGTIGQRYGATIRDHKNIKEFINNMKNDPFGRRYIIDLWQEDDFKTPGLNPCAFLTMWNVRKQDIGSNEEYFIDMSLIQRSGDMCVASGPGGINEIQYCALMLMMCKATGFKPGVFVHFIQNEQIYDRHIDNANIMLKRKSILANGERPKLILDTNNDDFFKFTIDDFKMVNYDEDKIKEVNTQLKFDLGV